MRRIVDGPMRGDRSVAALAESNAAARESSTCRLGFERDPSQCHRTILAGLIRASTAHAAIHSQPAQPIPLA